MECAALGILVGAGILKCVSIDPSHGNVGNLLCCVADTLIHNPTADVLPVPGDDGADAGVSPGVSAEVVDGSVIAHRGQDLLMLRANTQGVSSWLNIRRGSFQHSESSGSFKSLSFVNSNQL